MYMLLSCVKTEPHIHTTQQFHDIYWYSHDIWTNRIHYNAYMINIV